MGQFRCWNLVLVVAGLVTLQSSGQQAGVATGEAQLKTRSSSDNIRGPVVLDIVAKDKAGSPAQNLQAEDIVFTDNRKPVAGDLNLSRAGEMAGSAAAGETQLVFVIDAVNSNTAEIARSEDAIEGFLAKRKDKLDHPATILIVADADPGGRAAGTSRTPAGSANAAASNDQELRKRELFVHRIPASTDVNALLQALKDYKPGLRRILDAQGGLGQAERVRLSLEALSFIANAEESVPGAKIVMWISPGWPFLTKSDAKSSEQLFNSVIYFSNALRLARMILYSINPEGVTAKDNSAENEGVMLASRSSSIRASGRGPVIPTDVGDTYYAEFLKGVKTAKQSNPNDLALQVLAYQSGGLILENSNDLLAQIERCASDAIAVYTLTYTPAAGDGTDAYHELKVTAKLQQTLRTRTGFYWK